MTFLGSNFFNVNCFDNLKAEIEKMIRIYCEQIKTEENLNIDLIAEMCDGFTGADIKSLVCDSLIKAFHRTQETNQAMSCDFNEMKLNDRSQDVSLTLDIVISRADFQSGVENIERTINRSERNELTKM
jgi:SpoVK/Ycf46/Vps4 family AAA+-type ATPase